MSLHVFSELFRRAERERVARLATAYEHYSELEDADIDPPPLEAE